MIRAEELPMWKQRQWRLERLARRFERQVWLRWELSGPGLLTGPVLQQVAGAVLAEKGGALPESEQRHG